ncbi:MAG: hypothetical protein R2771_12815 [Saprospiraceae bacterium]
MLGSMNFIMIMLEMMPMNLFEIAIQNASDYTLSDFTVTLYNGNGGEHMFTNANIFTEGRNL